LAEGREQPNGECFALFSEYALGETPRVTIEWSEACLRFSACKSLAGFVEKSSFDGK
jgi:hypothetical protein